MRFTFIAVTILIAAKAATAQQTECQVTLAQYSQLQLGMAYEQVVSILGCYGSELSSNNIGGHSNYMLAWSGSGQIGANMNALFQDNQLIQKSQYGLQ